MKHSAGLWLRVLALFATFVIFGVLPALTVLSPVSVPTTALLTRSEGVFSFGSGRRPPLILSGRNGKVEMFSCRDHWGDMELCLHPRYAQSRGEVYWFWAKMPFGASHRYPVVVIADGQVVKDRETTIQHLKDVRFRVLFIFLPLSFVIFIAGFALMINLRSRRYRRTSSVS